MGPSACRLIPESSKSISNRRAKCDFLQSEPLPPSGSPSVWLVAASPAPSEVRSTHAALGSSRWDMEPRASCTPGAGEVLEDAGEKGQRAGRKDEREKGGSRRPGREEGSGAVGGGPSRVSVIALASPHGADDRRGSACRVPGARPVQSPSRARSVGHAAPPAPRRQHSPRPAARARARLPLPLGSSGATFQEVKLRSRRWEHFSRLLRTN